MEVVAKLVTERDRAQEVMQKQLDDGLAEIKQQAADHGVACFACLLIAEDGTTVVATDNDGWDRLKLMGLMDVLRQRCLEQLSYHYLEDLDDEE